MKLLIIEDDLMTREGLIKALDWLQIGVTNVFTAENGEAGLQMAKRVLPDIVLTGIRMPDMDGIAMASHIREILPECRIIFLSAHSEIGENKATFDLKAARFLDKPIETEGLRAVVSEAVAECIQLRQYKSTHDLHSMQEKQKFVDAICAGEEEETLENEFSRLKLHTFFNSKDHCTAIIVSFRLDSEGDMQKDLPILASLLSEAVIYPNLYVIRQKGRIELFLFTPTNISNYHKKEIFKRLQNVLGNHVYTIAVGKMFRGIGNANKSYISAKAVLDKAYLYPWGEIVSYSAEIQKTAGVSMYSEEKSEILRNVSEGNEKEALRACENLYQSLKDRKDLTFHKARELYFEIISEVFNKAESMYLQIKENELGEAVSWIVLIESYNLDELNSFLCRHISLYFASLEKAKDQKNQVLAIKNYIAKNYMNNSLSIADISGYLRMSASYVCTMFKKETNYTINNYLTEYRLKKAKQYLKESVFTITEISGKVGYSDSSYFGRIFRKHIGMTPNEYRNR